MLYIRADGNTEIGMGHVMRCLSIAEAAADLGSVPVFLTADGGCRELIEERGFPVTLLNTDYRDMMSELPLYENKNEGEAWFHKERDVILVDSYQVSCAYYSALRRLVRVACLEDMGEPYPADLLINYNLYAPSLAQNYKAPESGGTAGKNGCYPQKVLLGADYMPLRKSFQVPSEYAIRDKVTNVMITTGGSDPYFAAAVLADAIIKDRELSGMQIRLNIVSGPFNRYADQLKHRYQDFKNVTIHENVKDMRRLLLENDVVISAAGSTVYEVSSLGIPMVVFYFAENQRQGAEALGRLTDIVNAGCFAEDGGAVAHRVVQALKRCAGDRAYREGLSRQETGLIDGKGALRTAGQVLGLV